MVITAKLNKSKLLALALVLILGGGLIATLISGCSKEDAPKLSSNAERVSYLQSLGWEVSQEPVKTQQISVPEQMNEALARYNEVQLQQGMDLNDYLGQSAKRYVYLVSNYPDAPGDVYATLLISKDHLIAADLTCWEKNGFVRPLIPDSE